MAGDWIPMRHGLERERETLIVAARLSIRPDFATGLMRRFWCWTSDTTTDGFISGMTFEIIDQAVVDYAGFCEAMSAAGWLVQKSNGVRIPHFDHWLSANAKARLGEAKRKRLQRKELHDKPMSGKCPENVRTKTGPIRPTEQAEQRTEEKTKAGSPPLSEDARKPPAVAGPAPERVIAVSDLPACLPGLEAAALLDQCQVGEPVRSRLLEAGVTAAAIVRARDAAQQGNPRRWRNVMIADLQREYGVKRGGQVRGLAADVDRATAGALARFEELRRQKGVV